MSIYLKLLSCSPCSVEILSAGRAGVISCSLCAVESRRSERAYRVAVLHVVGAACADLRFTRALLLPSLKREHPLSHGPSVPLVVTEIV